MTGEHRYLTDAQVIRLGAEQCSVKAIFVFGKDILQIHRIIKLKEKGGVKSAVKVALNGEVKATSTRDGNLFIQTYLSITREGFNHSFFFRQKEFDQLLRARSSERIDSFEEFLDLRLFDQAKDLANTRRKSSQDDLSTQNSLCFAIEQQKLKDIHALTPSQLAKLADEVKTKQAELANLERTYLNYSEQVSRLEGEKKALSDQKGADNKRYNDYKFKLGSYENSLDELNTTILSKNKELGRLKQLIVVLNAEQPSPRSRAQGLRTR